MAGSDLKLNKLSFDQAAFMRDFQACINSKLDQLSISVQDLMMREIMANGNGSKVMRKTACEQVKEISRKISDTYVELVVGIDEDSLGDFSSQVFVRTAVVLHGNVASGPLRAIPNKLAWDKDVNNLRVSKNVKTEYILPDGMMQYEKVNGFGAERKMLDNIMNTQINHVVDDFLKDLENAVDYSRYIKVG